MAVRKPLVGLVGTFKKCVVSLESVYCGAKENI
jgi:hypothetical protein